MYWYMFTIGERGEDNFKRIFVRAWDYAAAHMIFRNNYPKATLNCENFVDIAPEGEPPIYIAPNGKTLLACLRSAGWVSTASMNMALLATHLKVYRAELLIY